MVRPLVITPEVKDAIKVVVDFASEEAHWYKPAEEENPPGNDPHYCIELNSYRCVFSLTQMPDGSLYRHLSVSVPTWKEGHLPHPAAFNEIAQLFGFPDMCDALHSGYQLAHNVEDGCVIAVFPITWTN